MDQEPAWKRFQDKNDVIRWERTNFRMVALYAMNGAFWGGSKNSALFMRFLVQSEMSLSNDLRYKLDYYVRESLPTVYYNKNQIERIKERIPKLGYTVIRDDEKYFVFRLKEEVTPARVKEWMRDEESVRERIEAYFVPLSSNTELYQLLKELGSEVMWAIDHLKGDMKNVMGGRLMAYILDIYRLYIKIDGTKDGEQARAEMVQLVEEFSFFCSVLFNVGTMENKRMVKIGERLMVIRKILVSGRKGGKKLEHPKLF